MSEPIIVAETKVKDPRRVAAGKRLGAISKQRKEEKCEALRLEREAQAQAHQVADNEYTLYLIGGLVMVGAASCQNLNKDKVMRTLPQMFTSDKKKLSTISEDPASAMQPTEGRTPSTSPPKRKSNCVFGD